MMVVWALVLKAALVDATDTTPPVLSGMTVTPTSLDVSEATTMSAQITVELDISDDISGMASSYIYFASPSGDIKSPPGSGGDCWYHGRQAVSGPIYTGLGHSSSHCFWVRGMETGDWIVAYVGVKDYLSNDGFYCGAAWCSAYPSECSSKNCLGTLDLSASTVTLSGPGLLSFFILRIA